MWTDGITVLQLLESSSKQPVFVANRLGDILETATVDEWYHIDTGNNPADKGTRGIAAEASFKRQQLDPSSKLLYIP